MNPHSEDQKLEYIPCRNISDWVNNLTFRRFLSPAPRPNSWRHQKQNDSLGNCS